MDKETQKYISIVPSARQKAYEDMGFNIFFHYGMNTFTDSEWGDGNAEPSNFNPKMQDTDQWIKTIKDLGAKGVIFTCKHHDGFCLWQTKTTDYSVKSSPYKNGEGDVVKEVSDSCKKYGVKFGVYLSPWDRNSKYYATDKYNDFYIEQLTELLTNYGELFCVWLDGACGSHLDGKPMQEYDFDRIYATIRKLQPNACISSCGPDIRWVGNEGGHTRESEWSVIPAFLSKSARIIAESQQNEDGELLQKITNDTEDIGSRKVLSKTDKYIWYPAEVDYSIHKGWFYHEDDEKRTLRNLLNVYYNSVGGNCTLLLNIPPNKDGLISKEDVELLGEFSENLKDAFKNKVNIKKITAPQCENGNFPENCLIDNESFYSPRDEANEYKIQLTFQKKYKIDKVVLKEQCDFSQRIEKFKIFAKINNRNVKVYDGTVIGFSKFALFKSVETDLITVVITQCRSTPHIKTISVYEENGGIPQYTRKELAIGKIHREIDRCKLKKWRKYQAKLVEQQRKG